MILLSVSLVSISLFIYQVILNRIYSTLFWYHYTFLITSFAIFGLGIGGIVAYNQRQKVNAFEVQSLYKSIIMLSISYIASLGIIYILPFQNDLLVYLILAALPFVIGGYYFSSVFRELAGISNKLYFADLIGSGLGSVVVLLSLNNLGIFRSVILICIISSLAALLCAKHFKVKSVSSCILLTIFLIGLFIPARYVYSIEQNFNGFITNKTKTLGSLYESGKKGKIVFTKWNVFSRTDVIKIEGDPNEMILTIDGAANAPMYKFDGKISSLNKYKKDIEYLPFSFGRNDKTLIIGPGGGRDILYALTGNSKDITGVEINTSSIDAVKYFKGFNGNIYGRPEVRIYGQDGRNFIRKSKEKYDVIYLSLVMTNASQNIGYALSENYLYTIEAVQDYMDHLAENGKIAFLAHDEEDLSKLAATIIHALNNKGIPIKDTPKYIAIFRQKMAQNEAGDEHIHYPMLIVKNKPFTVTESNQLKYTAAKGQNSPLYIPHVAEKGPLYHISNGHLSLTGFESGFPFNATPATDNKPYFYNFNKETLLVLMVILFTVLLGSVVLFAPIVSRNKILKPALYFSGLGIGYMLIETPLIQKFILYLGHPVIAFTYILAALLIGSGIGGYFSNIGLFNPLKKIYMPALIVVGISIALVSSLSTIFNITSHFNLLNKILISTALVMIQGFFMGMPFPRGIRILSASGNDDIIAVMWGVNGVMSIAGSVLSVILSMEFGFNIAILAGGVVYALISLSNKFILGK